MTYMWKNNLLFKILVSCTDNGKKKNLKFQKRKSASPPLKQIRVVLANNLHTIN